jgi:hypothetical protein
MRQRQIRLCIRHRTSPIILEGIKILGQSNKRIACLDEGILLYSTQSIWSCTLSKRITEGRRYSRPRQIRGPPLNGIYSHVREEAFSSHRSGRNSSASGPQISVCRCIEYKLNGMTVSFFTKMGPLPSGPPPRGRDVSLNDIRLLMGTGGRRRRAKYHDIST